MGNEVKHNDLYITRVEKKQNLVLKSGGSFMKLQGNPTVKKIRDGIIFFPDEPVTISVFGEAGFKYDGTISLGSGEYNLNTKEANNLDTKMYYENIVMSKMYNENIIDILNLIFKKESQLVSNIEKLI